MEERSKKQLGIPCDLPLKEKEPPLAVNLGITPCCRNHDTEFLAPARRRTWEGGHSIPAGKTPF